jgi:phage terminase large subunit-like protein
MSALRDITAYAENILSGKILSGKYIKLACDRFFRDLSRKDIYFDEKAANHIIGIYKFFPHIKGKWATKHIHLEPWQKFFIGNIYGWKRSEDGNRKYNIVYFEVARKNAKTTIVAPLALNAVFGDDEPGAEVYSFANSKEQASIVFDISRLMAMRSPFEEHLDISKSSILYNEDSVFRALASNDKKKDGLNTHFAIADEVHEMKKRNLWDVMESSIGSRAQPLLIAITTAGDDKTTICYELHSYTKKILELKKDDIGDNHFGMIYSIDKEDEEDWQNEDIWIKANPNLGISAKTEAIRAAASKAKIQGGNLKDFLRKRLNVWVEGGEAWISPEVFRKNNLHEIYLKKLK